MAKYEIMLVVDGSLEEAKATAAVKELVNLVKKSKNFKTTNLGLKDLAYKINNRDKG